MLQESIIYHVKFSERCSGLVIYINSSNINNNAII